MTKEEFKSKYVKIMTKKAQEYADSVIVKELWMDEEDVEGAKNDIIKAFFQGADASKDVLTELVIEKRNEEEK